MAVLIIREEKERDVKEPWGREKEMGAKKDHREKDRTELGRRRAKSLVKYETFD